MPITLNLRKRGELSRLFLAFHALFLSVLLLALHPQISTSSDENFQIGESRVIRILDFIQNGRLSGTLKLHHAQRLAGFYLAAVVLNLTYRDRVFPFNHCACPRISVCHCVVGLQPTRSPPSWFIWLSLSLNYCFTSRSTTRLGTSSVSPRVSVALGWTHTTSVSIFTGILSTMIFSRPGEGEKG